MEYVENKVTVGQVAIEQLTAVGETAGELAEMLIDVVEDGASIGFLPPLSLSEAASYWESVPGEGVILLVARMNGIIAGTVQLHLCMKPNGAHRAEVAKLMTHSQYRRAGIGRALMQAVEERARQDDRTLLVLDTREGDPSNLLYGSLGYTLAGTIPSYSKSANGSLDGTNYYYKLC